MDSRVIDRMRRNYTLVVNELRNKGWSDEDVDEYGESFKSALESGDQDRIRDADTHLNAMVLELCDINTRIRASTAAKPLALDVLG